MNQNIVVLLNHALIMITILEMRQRGRFAGFSFHTSNNRYMDKSSHCYKNRHELPPLNFSTTCIASGRYVTFYNERLDGSTYPAGYIVANVITELCEFIVKGKITGYL